MYPYTLNRNTGDKKNAGNVRNKRNRRSIWNMLNIRDTELTTPKSYSSYSFYFLHSSYSSYSLLSDSNKKEASILKSYRNSNHPVIIDHSISLSNSFASLITRSVTESLYFLNFSLISGNSFPKI